MDPFASSHTGTHTHTHAHTGDRERAFSPAEAAPPASTSSITSGLLSALPIPSLPSLPSMPSLPSLPTGIMWAKRSEHTHTHTPTHTHTHAHTQVHMHTHMQAHVQISTHTPGGMLAGAQVSHAQAHGHGQTAGPQGVEGHVLSNPFHPHPHTQPLPASGSSYVGGSSYVAGGASGGVQHGKTPERDLPRRAVSPSFFWNSPETQSRVAFDGARDGRNVSGERLRGSFTSLGSLDGMTAPSGTETQAHTHAYTSAADPTSPPLADGYVPSSDDDLTSGTRAPSGAVVDAMRLTRFLQHLRTTPFDEFEASLSQLLRENAVLRDSLSSEARENDALRREIARMQADAQQLHAQVDRQQRDNERLVHQLYEWRMERWDSVSFVPKQGTTSAGIDAPGFSTTQHAIADATSRCRAGSGDDIPATATGSLPTADSATGTPVPTTAAAGVGALAARARQALPSFSSLTTALASAAPTSVSNILQSLGGPSRDDAGASAPPNVVDFNAWLKTDAQQNASNGVSIPLTSRPTSPPPVPAPNTRSAITKVMELVDKASAVLDHVNDDTGSQTQQGARAQLREHLEDLLCSLSLVADQLQYALSARVSVMKAHDLLSPSMSVGAAERSSQALPSSDVPLLLSPPTSAYVASATSGPATQEGHGTSMDAKHVLGTGTDVLSAVAGVQGPEIPSPAAFDAMKKLAQDAVRRASMTGAASRASLLSPVSEHDASSASAESPLHAAAAGLQLADAAHPPGMRDDAAPRAMVQAPASGKIAEPLALLPLEASPLHTRFAVAQAPVISASYCPIEVLRGQQDVRPSEHPASPRSSGTPSHAHAISVADAIDPAAGVTHVDPSATDDIRAQEVLAVHALEKVAADALDEQHTDSTVEGSIPPAVTPSDSGHVAPAADVRGRAAIGQHKWGRSHSGRLHHSLKHLPASVRARLLSAQSHLPHPMLNAIRPGRGLRILCLDGGGIRGLLMLECLKKMEADCGRRIVDMFDLICGTSTGGFLSVALAMRKSLEEIAIMYEHIRTTVGGQSSILSEMKRFTTGTSHDHTVAEQQLRGFFGDAKMSDLPLSPKVFVLCAAVNFMPVQAYLFRSYELTPEAFASAEILGTSQVPAALAVRATTSAPTYYAPAVIGTERMVDGAIVDNNPTLIALSEVALLWPGARIDALVSLGTGTQSLRPSAANSVMSWIRTVLDLALSSHITHKIAATLLGDVYFRFDPDTAGDVELTESRLDVLARMLEDGRRYIQRMEPEFARLRKVLV